MSKSTGGAYEYVGIPVIGQVKTVFLWVSVKHTVWVSGCNFDLSGGAVQIALRVLQRVCDGECVYILSLTQKVSG